MRSIDLNLRALLVANSVLLGLAGCAGPRAVRGSDHPELDAAAMSTGLDKRDLQQLLQENLGVLWKSAAVNRWRSENRPATSILPIRNETSEHIDSALQSLLSDFETELINSQAVRVVSMENQQRLVAEIQQQQGGAYDQTQVASWGKQLGVRYVITGKVFSNDERASNARRVQYSLFVQVLSVETSEVLFQNKASVTKAIVK